MRSISDFETQLVGLIISKLRTYESKKIWTIDIENNDFDTLPFRRMIIQKVEICPKSITNKN